MKLNFITVIRSLFVFLLFFVVSCKTSKNTQTESSQVKANVASSKERVNETTANQQSDNTRKDSAASDEQSDFEWEMFTQETPVLDSNGKSIGNATYTRIKGKGKKQRKENKTTQQSTKETTAVKANEASAEKKNLDVKGAAAAKHTKTTLRFGVISWWVIILLALIALAYWKRRQIVAYVKNKIGKLITGTPPNTNT